MDYGLTPQGFIPKPLQVVKSELETEFRSAFGDDLDMSPDSVAGELIGNLSLKFANIWEMLALIYASFNPDSATGVSLDRASALVNVERLSAQPAEVVVAMFGDEGTLIPSGNQIRQSTTLRLFTIDRPTTLSLLQTLYFEFDIDTILPTQLYSFVIDGTTISYTSGASPSASDIRAGLIADLLIKFPTFAASNETSFAIVQSPDGSTPFVLTFDDVNLEIVRHATRGRYLANIAGILAVPEGTVNTIINPVTGYDSVINLAPGDAGSEIESDTELRIRRRRDQLQGTATDEAIRTAILRDVDNVDYATVISNRTDAPDGDGRPAHSFEAVVEGGLDEDIADVIWKTQPSGIQPYGSTTVQITDSEGNLQDVSFSRPTPVYIWIKIEITRYTEEAFPAGGEDIIKDLLTVWGLANQNIGVDVILQRLFAPIYQVSGIADAALTMTSTATLTPAPGGGSYLANNIPIAADEIGLIDSSRIQVLVL